MIAHPNHGLRFPKPPNRKRALRTQPNAAIRAIFSRRSVGKLIVPGPSEGELITILRAGAAAPDHKLTRPFWFVVFEGKSREEFGIVLAEALASRLAEKGIEPTNGQVGKEQAKLMRAPLVIAVAAVRSEEISLPDQEIISAAAAAAQNMLLAATSLGYGSIWRTGEAAYDPKVKAALGIKETDFIIGFLYFGSITEGLAPEPHDPDIRAIASSWEG